MEKIKVKAYGLINFTKEQYLTTQTVVFAIIFIIIISYYILDLSNHTNFFISKLHLFFLLILVLEIAETLIMLQKFKEKEKKAHNIRFVTEQSTSEPPSSEQ